MLNKSYYGMSALLRCCGSRCAREVPDWISVLYEKAKHLPKHYEPAIMDHNGNIDPWELVEDELILALPMFAYHVNGECEIKQPKADTEQVEVTEKDDNPFAVLQQLKSK
jgi:uncharacterized protein